MGFLYFAAETYKLNRERESQWYFFTSREKKYPNGSRPKRNAGELGYWKATGTDKAILDGKKPMGFRKSLDYYEGRQRDGTKTNWKMHEYLLHQSLVPSGATARGKNPLQPKQVLIIFFLSKIHYLVHFISLFTDFFL